jgi:hypothetical protein
MLRCDPGQFRKKLSCRGRIVNEIDKAMNVPICARELEEIEVLRNKLYTR